MAAARKAVAAKVDGIALEGDFPEGTAARVRELAPGATVIEITSRNRLAQTMGAPVIATYQGVWPGVGSQDDGSKKAGPTGSVWIDTNTGFLRSMRAWTDSAVWIANEP